MPYCDLGVRKKEVRAGPAGRGRVIQVDKVGDVG